MSYRHEGYIGDVIVDGLLVEKAKIIDELTGVKWRDSFLYHGSFVDGVGNTILVLSDKEHSWRGSFYYNVGSTLPASVYLKGVEIKFIELPDRGNQFVVELDSAPETEQDDEE